MYINFLLVLLAICLNMSTEFDSNITRSKPSKRKSLTTLVFSKNYSSQRTSNEKINCEWLQSLKHQKKLCKRYRGLAAILIEARDLAINSCQNEFRYNQWNCTQRKKFLKKIYRETALMYSLTTAALMYSLSKACGQGKLVGCQCGPHGKDPPTGSDWQWGYCSDNTKFAKSFTRRFLRLKFKNDAPTNILNYNSKIGIQTVIEHEIKDCKCHGLSNSCTFKICYKKLRPFNEIAHRLREHYHSATRVETPNSIHSLKENVNKLIYLDESPNFCPLTVGRRCNNSENCATLCCGRGFVTNSVEVINRCHCRWRNNTSNFQVTCDRCSDFKTILNCR